MELNGVLRCALRTSQHSMKGLSDNLNLNWNYVIKHPEGINGKKWRIDSLSNNQFLPWNYVMKYPDCLRGKYDCSWDMYSLSSNPSLPWDYVVNNPDGFNGQNWDTPLRVASFATKY